VKYKKQKRKQNSEIKNENFRNKIVKRKSKEEKVGKSYPGYFSRIYVSSIQICS